MPSSCLTCGCWTALICLVATACTGYVSPLGPNPSPGHPPDPAPQTPGATHWAFRNPERPVVPESERQGWVKQPIDGFILAGLQTAGLVPSPEADRRTLIRRASLDVRGLPPNPEEIAAFVNDPAADAYEQLVDRLLADPAFGEHRAHYWLDVVRYADTHGFHADGYRSIWPYRDYVIRAFNSNLPFDRFTIDQLAGDLLPNATVDQKVATGFSRCAMSTSEGGSIEEEFAAIAAKDRVETVAAAWMGLTLGCAACHNHKFDPIAQNEFYQMTAFFRNTTQPVFDENLPDQAPSLLVGDDHTPSLIDGELPGAPFAYVLGRGRYDAKGERVTAGVPAFLPALPNDHPPNRLSLARWITSAANPLTARVVVNRFWAEVFGTGIVSTPENFGRAGAAPSNQPLLDWLAVEFRDSGWNVKQLFRLMLTSAAYRQSAVHTMPGQAVDPENRLVWRGPRFRMDAELIRDLALAVSGLLSRTMGGPPVKPYQPTGVWEAVAIDSSNTAVYQQDHGDRLFRRSVYTFWKRTAPPPSMETFNAPPRETTIVQRERTNTPLQALVTLDDPQFVEAARELAARVIHLGDFTDDARFDDMGHRVLARPFDAEEHVILRQALAAHLSQFQARPAEAAQLLAVGETPVDSSVPTATHAAWMMVAHAILNLDEALTK